MKRYYCTRSEPEQNFIRPGFGFVPKYNSRLWTVVGSSVAVTLYDARLKLGGMAHFTRPRRGPGVRASTWFAAPAILWLLRQMMSNGSRILDLEAQLFGGAAQIGHPEYSNHIHTENVRIGMELLRDKGVRIETLDVGGQRGRKVLFHSHTGESVVQRVDHIREADWYPQLAYGAAGS